ncbi:MAG: TonB-dependent receptor, partial [Chitinophaga rupis]
PISINGNLDINSRTFFMGNTAHRLSFGASAAVSGNRGPGIILDPSKPRYSSFNNQSQRPVNFDKTIPYFTNHGYYVQDNASGTVFGKKYTATIGLRTDVQNGFAAFQPRLSVMYHLSNAWSTSFAYGISTKAPSLADRYPAPAWIDIPVLDLYNGYANQSLFLVYTRKIETDNSRLRAAKSRSFEWGLNFKNPWSKASLVAYARINTDGFNSYGQYEPLYVPNYKYTVDPVTQKINYYPSGDSTLYAAIKRYTITNGLYTADYGAELMFSTKDIAPLSTSFSLRASLTYSKYDARGDREVVAVSDNYIQAGKPALFGVYRPKSNSSVSMISTVSSITHIPKLGFIVTLSTDLIMIKTTRNNPKSNDPIGYIDRQMQYVPIDGKEAGSAAYDYLRLTAADRLTTSLPFIYPCINVTIAKEIRKR